MQSTLIVDGTNVAHRAFYALKATPHGVPISPSGTPIAAISTVLRSLLSLVKRHNVRHMAVCFDNHTPTFRHKLFPEYKANRTPKDELLVADLEAFQDIMCKSRLGIVAPPGIEADDLIATLAKQTTTPKLIYSGDRDLFQLSDDSTTILYPWKKQAIILTPVEVEGRMQVKPFQIPEYKAIVGDNTDNIPGVKGVGEKTATELLSEFEGLDEIYNGLDHYYNLGKIRKRYYSHLKHNEDMARLSRQLAVLVSDATLPATPNEFDLCNFDIDAIEPTLNDFGLHTIARSYNELLDSLF